MDWLILLNDLMKKVSNVPTEFLLQMFSRRWMFFFSWFSWLWYYIILYIIEIWIHISKFPDFGFKNYLPLNGWIGSRYMFSSIWVIRYIVELYETNNDLKKFRSIRKNSFFNWFKIMLFFQYTEFFLIIIRQLSGESKSI